MKDDCNTEENARIVYQQRYETFRHLDRIRWLLYGRIAVLLSTGLGAVFVVLRYSDVMPSNFLFATISLFVGFFLLLSGLSMKKIGKGIHENSKVLHAFGQKIGDVKIPKTQTSWRSVAWWISMAAVVSGGALMVFSLGCLVIGCC